MKTIDRILILACTWAIGICMHAGAMKIVISYTTAVITFFSIMAILLDKPEYDKTKIKKLLYTTWAFWAFTVIGHTAWMKVCMRCM